jgi:hypothetical protein
MDLTDKKRRIVLIAVGIIILIAIIVLIFFSKKSEMGEKDVNEITFEYINYSIMNELFLKENCPAINVGRCDTFGGEFGVNCYTRQVNLFFDIKGISYEDITCGVNDAYKDFGEHNFEKEDSLIYLPVKVDIRKFNELSVCCSLEGSTEEVCFDSIGINAVC